MDCPWTGGRLLVDQLLVDQLLVDQQLVDQQLVDQQSTTSPWTVHGLSLPNIEQNKTYFHRTITLTSSVQHTLETEHVRINEHMLGRSVSNTEHNT